MRSNNFIDNRFVVDAESKLHEYMNSSVPVGTSVAQVYSTAQRVHTALQILGGTLDVVEAKITLEYAEQKAEK